MRPTSLPEKVIADILMGEKSAVRLFSDAHGYDYVPTSRSYDLGRDGRTSSTSPSGQVGVICCTTGEDIDRKSKDDIIRVLESITPVEILFCSTHHECKSEKNLQRVENELRSIAPQVAGISAFGTIQLVALVQRHPNAFEHRYAAELIEYQSFLGRETFRSANMQTDSLRLALATQFQEDAQKLRSEVLTTALLFTLSDQKQHTIERIAKSISDGLRLPRIIHQSYFRDSLNKLIKDGAVCVDNGLFSIRPEGQKLVRAREQRRDHSAKEGARLLQDEIETLLNRKFQGQEFSVVWKRIQDEFANLFFSNGLKVIRAIASLTAGPALPEPSRNYGQILADMQRNIAGAVGGGPNAEEIAQAVRDVLEDTSVVSQKYAHIIF
jgi:hypothetical protein